MIQQVNILACVNDIEEHNVKHEGYRFQSHLSLAGAKRGINGHSTIMAKILPSSIVAIQFECLW